MGAPTQTHTHWPVVVVGAGPAGLTTAITLASAGVRCLVVERRTRPSSQPRATVVSLRSMELIRSWGIENAVRAGGDPVSWKMLLTTTLADAAAGQTIDVGYPTDDQSTLLSPTSVACVPQDHLEAVLLAHLRTLPAARVVVGAAVEEVGQDHGTTRVRFSDDTTGASHEVTARYVVGADGAHSRVRQAIGAGGWSSGRLLEAVSVLFRGPVWETVGAYRHGIYAVTHPQATGTFLPAGHGDRWLYSFPRDPDVEDLESYPQARLVEMIRTGAGDRALPLRIESVGTFAFVASLADRFRIGSVFLVGDAAHRVTPRGGTGMNTAIADGYDLGWKLSWVLSGWDDDTLLDTYEDERRPVAEHNVTRSMDPMGSRREVPYEVGVDLGGRLRHLWLPGTTISTLDLLGPGLTLLTTDASTPGPTSAAPVDRHVIDTVSARAIGMRGSDLLLRPDGLPWTPRRRRVPLPGTPEGMTRAADAPTGPLRFAAGG